jgi:hypothetical protein
MSQIISYSNSVSEYKIIEKNGNSKYPKLKNTAVIVIAIAITSANISINRSNQLNISSKSKNDTLSISNINKSKFETFPNIENSKEEDKMSDFKLNEVQKYFDEKISDTNNVIHIIDKKVYGIEKDIKTINDNVSNLKNEIPSIIEKSLAETKKKQKEKFWDRYSAPIITGLILIVLQVLLDLFKLI